MNSVIINFENSSCYSLRSFIAKSFEDFIERNSYFYSKFRKILILYYFMNFERIGFKKNIWVVAFWIWSFLLFYATFSHVFDVFSSFFYFYFSDNFWLCFTAFSHRDLVLGDSNNFDFLANGIRYFDKFLDC